MAQRLTRKEVADIMEAFIDGTGGKWDWDNFCSVGIEDPALEAIRDRVTDLPAEDPHPEHYCGPRGIQVMRDIVATLRKE